jgi:hypothetical protein
MLGLWRAATAALGRSASGELPADVLDELFVVQNELRKQLFEDGAVPTPGEPRVSFVLDALEVLSLSSPDDPSHPWARAGLLATLGRHLEAADDFLIAARGFEREAELGNGLTGDEADWAKSSYWHAARNLALGGQPAAAASLLRSLAPADRAEVADLVEECLARLERSAAG